ncbi:MAG: HAD hydrolase-like protein [Saprospiraceae bacterium]|nr:HAD hydrolase-like protein [Saprospiraceae bacterium]
MKKYVELVVFDMAGTTVRDEREVETCFYEAATQSGLTVSRARINDMQGLPKLQVVQTLWDEAIGNDHPDFEHKTINNYNLFTQILEHHYLTQPIYPTEGALETFAWLRSEAIAIALTTGFYRKVADIILNKLNWKQRYLGFEEGVIDLSLTPDETGKGRPYPDMIWKAMEILEIKDAKKVVNIGDTPVDLQSGKAANCLFSLGVTNGTHTQAQLEQYDNDGLLPSMTALKTFLQERLNS